MNPDTSGGQQSAKSGPAPETTLQIQFRWAGSKAVAQCGNINVTGDTPVEAGVKLFERIAGLTVAQQRGVFGALPLEAPTPSTGT